MGTLLPIRNYILIIVITKRSYFDRRQYKIIIIIIIRIRIRIKIRKRKEEYFGLGSD